MNHINDCLFFIMCKENYPLLEELFKEKYILSVKLVYKIVQECQLQNETPTSRKRILQTRVL